MSAQTTKAPYAITAKNLLLFALLFFTTLQLPSWPVTDGLHDPGAVAALEYWTKHGKQYGTEIVQNVGPLGFISNPKLYTGFLDHEKMILSFLFTAAYAALIIMFAKRLPSQTARIILYLNVILFSAIWAENSYGNADIKLYLLMLLGAYVILFDEESSLSFAVAVMLGFLALAKGTFLIIALLIMAFGTPYYLLRRRFISALLMPALFAGTVVVLWLAHRQHMQNLPVFLNNMLGLSNNYAAGYTDAMFKFEPLHITLFGITTILLACIAIMLRNFSGFSKQLLHEKCRSLACACIEGAILFVTWKHGFIRADGHTVTFFYFLQIAGSFFLLMPATRLGNVRALSVRSAFMISCLCGTVLCTMQLRFVDKAQLSHEAIRNTYVAFTFEKYIDDLACGLRESVEAMQFPVTRALVKMEPVGYFGYLPAPMLYNSFTYAPMPNTISFTGWSHASMLADAAFYANPTSAPAYVLYTQGTIDNRISAQDDALAQLEILNNYDLVADAAIIKETGNRIVLKRREAAPAIKHTPVPMRTNQRKTGEWVDAPHTEDPLRVIIRMHHKPVTSVVKALYKPPEYQIELKLSDGTTPTRKFMARMAEDGFLIAPFIDNNRHFIQTYNQDEYERYRAGKSKELARVTSLRITCKNLFVACADDFDVSFETLEGLELGRLHIEPSAQEAFNIKPNLQ